MLIYVCGMQAISKVVQTPIMPFSTSNTMPEDTSRVAPQRTQLVGMKDPIMPFETSNVMQKDMSRCVMPPTSRLDTPITRVTSSEIPHTISSTSSIDAPSIPVEMDIHVPIINNPSNVGSIRILAPTPEQVSLRNVMESQ